jgi:ferredoxin
MNNSFYAYDEAREMLKRPKLSISPKNAKLGNIPSFSSLPTDGYIRLSDGRTVADGLITGTCTNCAECAKSCYAARPVKMYPATAKAWAQNTILQKIYPSRLGMLLDDWLNLNEPRYFRFFVSGDFFAPADTAVLLNTARRHTETKFYAYTKNTALIEDYSARHGMPANVTILASEWNNNPITGDYPRFIYDDLTREELRNVWHCPAVSPTGHKTGVTCIQCKACIRAKAGDKIAVYAH